MMQSMRNTYGKGSLIAAALLGACILGAKPSAAQDVSAAKGTLCVSCSVDGKTTPRMPDGHPDLNGFWGGGAAPPPGQKATAPAGFNTVIQRSADGSILFDFGTEYNAENGLGRICAPLDQSCQQPNQPPYTDKYMAKVKEIAKTEFGGTTALDPIQDCRPAGVPRAGSEFNGLGITGQIVQTKDIIAILYSAAPYSTYRIVYMNRPHTDMKKYETTYMGDSVGHWDGDTLVIDTTGFNDDTWLGGGGATGTQQFTSIHSDKLHVIERLAREGDVLNYDVTVEDPEAFTHPWVLATRRIRHSPAGNEVPGEDALTESICTPTEHFVLPNPEDQDIKNKCGYRCQK